MQNDGTTSPDVLQERLNSLADVSKEGFARLEHLITQMDARLRTMETSTMSDLAVMKTRLDSAWKKLDKHSEDISAHENFIQSAKPSIEVVNGLTDKLTEHDRFIEKTKPLIKAIVWLAGVIGVLIIGFLWAIFTHQITITN